MSSDAEKKDFSGIAFTRVSGALLVIYGLSCAGSSIVEQVLKNKNTQESSEGGTPAPMPMYWPDRAGKPLKLLNEPLPKKPDGLQADDIAMLQKSRVHNVTHIRRTA